MQCDTCGEVFRNHHGLRIHQGRKHPGNYRVSIVSAHAQIVRDLVAAIQRRADELEQPFEVVARGLVDASTGQSLLSIQETA